MGVTGLWTVVQPCARPVKIETLNRKRLAVDASIWIYQFLKAVRDKEGNALRNSHVVGFFRRICKLLFIGIKPIFVFDGGAPILKRQTVAGRKSRREGRREDAVRTAGKLLALQMQRRAEEDEQKRKEGTRRNAIRDEEPLPEDLVYVDELQMTQQERQQNRKFKKKDQYHLPDLDATMAELAGPNDPRVMSLEELEQHARQFDTGEDINVYDFSKIDFNSPFFMSLPASDRYNILNAARLRSRLRMGLSKDQLDDMFPDRMAFSRFQIERVTERNELTQRLMHVSGMTDDDMFGINGGGRVAGEKGREYVLVKNDGVEGGWALGVIGEKDQGERNKPIDIDELDKRRRQIVDDEGADDEDDFEDVPIEGLNRLPKVQSKPRVPANEAASRSILQKRTNEYAARRNRMPNKPAKAPAQSLQREESNSLFVGEDVPMANEDAAEEQPHETDDEELQRAIAMSLENDHRASSPEDDDFEEVFHERPAQGETNGTAKAAAPVMPFQDDSDDDTMDFAGALAESRQDKHRPRHSQGAPLRVERAGTPSAAKSSKYDGPLPFERLDLGSSLLGRKKAVKLDEEREGGFEKEDPNSKRAATPPPWFTGDVGKDLDAQKVMDREDRERDREQDEQEAIEFLEQPRLRMQDTLEVIDVDALDEKSAEVIDVDASDEDFEPKDSPQVVPEDYELRMGDLADMIRAEPPHIDLSRPPSPSQLKPSPTLSKESISPNFNQNPEESAVAEPTQQATNSTPPVYTGHVEEAEQSDRASEDETIEWEASDHEQDPEYKERTPAEIVKPAGGTFEAESPRSPSPEVVNIGNPDTPLSPEVNLIDNRPSLQDDEEELIPAAGTANDQAAAEYDSDTKEYYSDDAEDEELMHQLAIEAEEHARFASQLNQRSQRHNIEEYERELKQLRTQQKKDRRDADEVTQVMITECQQLLKLFGLPYITAPMEAEAQCAELVHLGLVDGIVTDDSDIFLFGGTRVYKNMFNQAKFVECYLGADLEREFDLTRRKLIALANLLGSDYTEGLPGVGPVTALEIVSEFPDGLDKFREWWTIVQSGAPAAETDGGSAFRRKFRRSQATKLFLAPGFPDKRVEAAYLHPEVDSDPSEFQWGVPDLDALRAYLMATIGWGPDRTDEVLVPVIRDMNRRETEGTQANITRFMGAGSSVGAGAFAPRKKATGKSKRMEEALEKMAGRARRKRKAGESGSEQGEDENDDVVRGEDAVIAQEGSQVERQGLVGRADVIAAQPKRKAATSKVNGKRKARRKVDADDNNDDNDTQAAGSEEEESAPKRKKRAPRKKN